MLQPGALNPVVRGFTDEISALLVDSSAEGAASIPAWGNAPGIYVLRGTSAEGAIQGPPDLSRAFSAQHRQESRILGMEG
jgi:hypothetical protein